RPPQRRHRLRRPRGGGVANPHAAVEVEQRVVVAAEKRRKGHDGGLSLAAVSRPLALVAALAMILVGAVGCGADREGLSKTTASFASLARMGFYDGRTFHRIVPGDLIQGGDPHGDGSGGPGYHTVEAPPSSLKYTRGVVAMGKTEIDDPGTAGSQFFIVTGP